LVGFLGKCNILEEMFSPLINVFNDPLGTWFCSLGNICVPRKTMSAPKEVKV
jgi:hypothetical protein